MGHRFSLLRLTWRLGVLAILCASLAYLWADSKVLADMNTSCYTCDYNNATSLSNCGGTRDSCLNQCQQNGNPPGCTDTCWNNYNSCTNSTWNNYDNCLYGFLDNSGLCAITGSGGSPPPAGHYRTPCDNACKQQMLDCRAEGGTDCGATFNECSLTCG